MFKAKALAARAVPPPPLKRGGSGLGSKQTCDVDPHPARHSASKDARNRADGSPAPPFQGGVIELVAPLRINLNSSWSSAHCCAASLASAFRSASLRKVMTATLRARK